MAVIESAFACLPVKLSGFYILDLTRSINQVELDRLRMELRMDINRLPSGYDPDTIRLFVTDMDSTFINIECIDEIADMVGVKSEVANITELAMRGELDFPSALQQRVKCLTGLSSDKLEQVYEQRLRLNPGADRLLRELKNQGIKIALVSGGFSYFTEKLKQRYQLDFALANHLEINNNRLTGRVSGPIIDSHAKAAFLLDRCQKMEINPQQVIAIGDGANDLKMMAVSGLGIAYHAKQTVQKQADIRFDYRNLDAVCDLITRG